MLLAHVIWKSLLSRYQNFVTAVKVPQFLQCDWKIKTPKGLELYLEQSHPREFLKAAVMEKNFNAFYDILRSTARKKLGWDFAELNLSLSCCGLSSQHLPVSGKVLLQTLLCCGKRSQQDRGGQKSTPVCGSHHRILHSPGQFRDPGDQLLNPVFVTCGTGLLSSGETGQTLARRLVHPGMPKAPFAVADPRVERWAGFRRCQVQWAPHC